MKLHPALKVGLGAALATSALGAIVGLVFAQQNPAIGWMIFKRLTIVGIAIGLSAGIARIIQRSNADGKAIGKDWGSVGALIGMVLAGYFTQHGLTASPGMQRVQAGEAFEIAGPQLDGQQFSLQQYRGKVVLVDFWATWCGPCVAELPNVKAVYQQYHDQGLEIVGVSFDQERSALEEFVKAEQIPWPQIFFDDEAQQGFNNPNGVRYQIEAIPCMMLVDKDGRLIARNLRGHEVQTAVAQALGIPPTIGERVTQIAWQALNWLTLGIMSSRWYLLIIATIIPSAAVALLQRMLSRQHGVREAQPPL